MGKGAEDATVLSRIIKEVSFHIVEGIAQHHNGSSIALNFQRAREKQRIAVNLSFNQLHQIAQGTGNPGLMGRCFFAPMGPDLRMIGVELQRDDKRQVGGVHQIGGAAMFAQTSENVTMLQGRFARNVIQHKLSQWQRDRRTELLRKKRKPGCRAEGRAVHNGRILGQLIINVNRSKTGLIRCYNAPTIAGPQETSFRLAYAQGGLLAVSREA